MSSIKKIRERCDLKLKGQNINSFESAQYAVAHYDRIELLAEVDRLKRDGEILKKLLTDTAGMKTNKDISFPFVYKRKRFLAYQDFMGDGWEIGLPEGGTVEVSFLDDVMKTIVDHVKVKDYDSKSPYGLPLKTPKARL